MPVRQSPAPQGTQSSNAARAVRLGGALAFAGSAVVFARWWQTAGAARPFASASAVAIDVVLFAAFALHHSVLARPFAKAWLTQVVPASLLRSCYVWVASALFALTALAWQPVGGVAWTANGVLRAALMALQALGLVVLLLAGRRISVRELAGLTSESASTAVETRGPYGVVRHPLYLGVLLLFAAATPMTGDRLLFTGLTLGYVLVAMPYEEAGLSALLGPPYDTYRKQVPWRLIPFVH